MAANYTGVGSTIQYANTGTAKTSGQVVIVGQLVGICETDIAATTGVGTVCIEGEFDVPANSADVMTVGMKLVWDASASEFVDANTPATGDNTGGVVCVVAKAASVTTVRVKLCPGSGVTT